MADWLGATFLAVGFGVLLKVLPMERAGRRVVDTASDSLATIQDGDLSDREKERRLQSATFRLLADFVILAAGGAAALLVPVGLVWLGERMGLVELESVLETTLSPLFLVLATVAGGLLVLHASSRKAGTADGDGDQTSYSLTDRMLHDVAFATYPAQAALSSLEDRLWARSAAADRPARPVFITGLPRAGTTLLLESCAASPEFASHRYRDLPFLPVPLLWSRYTSVFQRRSERRERAHADGMMIDQDSPEALEEILWLLFWEGHYQPDRIVPWDADERNAKFLRFFERHMAKLVHLRREPGGADEPPPRYVSKNNLNIARLGWLRRNLPDAVLLVPFRDPVQHAASLLRQHRRFLEMHRSDAFSARYMRALGHFDFGAHLRPVDFGGWLDGAACEDPLELQFWLEYWTATYAHVLSAADDLDLRLLSYERFASEAAWGMERLGELVESRRPERLGSEDVRVRAPEPREVDVAAVDPEVLAASRGVHEDLMGRGAGG